MARDNFSQSAKDTLAKRVAYKCSNPQCRCSTTGPHQDTAKSVNIGVASHITAAAPGGPRFDPLLSPDERMSTDNGIWLCQRCAKLIDNDVSRHTKELLRRWKVAAEAAADRALKGTPPVEFFPQPSAALHTPIPNIQGLPYENARPLLINAGWQPRGYSMGHGSEPTLQYGNGQYFWDKGFHEIMDACPTGLAHCRFRYDDVYGNRLVVTTSGMVSLESEATAHISSWRFEDYG